MANSTTSEREWKVAEVLAVYLAEVEAGRAIDWRELVEKNPEIARELVEYFSEREAFGKLLDSGGDEASEPRASVDETQGSGKVAEGETVDQSDRDRANDGSPPGTDDFGESEGEPDGVRVRYFGDYELRKVLGRGGMGIVFEGRQLSLNRPVALKMIRSGMWAEAEEVRRFQNEAEAVAGLDHQGIVPVYEVGKYRGRHYFSMKLVEGPSLDKVLGDYFAKPKATARLLSETAKAVHHAHQRGILHRDLKPSNILVDREGAPHVTDFGLSRRIEGAQSFSMSGAILGTPQYMSPEQASGARRSVTTSTDVYGLGSVLYTLLAGRPPFQADSVLETLRQVRETPPAPIRKHNPRAPRDLEVIALKCLEKDSRLRYSSAAGLSEDLERYLRGEPILARRASVPERALKWCKRKPAIATLLSLLLITALGGVVGILWQWRRAEDSRERAVVARNDAMEARKVSESQRIEAQRRTARLALERGIDLCHKGEVGQGMLWLARTLETLPAGEADLERVARINLDGWRRRTALLLDVFHHRGTVAAISPDGKRLLSGGASSDGKTGEARVWDVLTKQPASPILKHAESVRSAGFSRDGSRFLTISGERLQVWDATTFTAVGEAIPVPRMKVSHFSPDGKFIAAVDPSNPKRKRFHDAMTGRPLGGTFDFEDEVWRSAYSPDGRRYVCSDKQGVARLWDVHAGEPIGKPLWRDLQNPLTLTFSAAGTKILAQGFDAGGVNAQWRLWDSSRGVAIGPDVVPHGYVYATSVSWSRDDKHVLTSSWDRTARIWDAVSGKERVPAMKHDAPVNLASFNEDETIVATASHDSSVRLWNAATGEPLTPSLRHPDWVLGVRFDSRSGTMLTICRDGVIRTWGLPKPRSTGVTLSHDAPVFRMEIAKNNVLMTQTWHAESGLWNVELWNLNTKTKLTPPPWKAPRLLACMSKRGDVVLVGRAIANEPARLWDVAAARPRGEPIELGGEFLGAAFLPDGDRFITFVSPKSSSRKITEGKLWETSSVRSLGLAVNFPSDWPSNIVFSRDSTSFILQEGPSVARLWDSTTWKPVGAAYSQSVVIRSMGFHPDGRTIVFGGDDGIVRIWDAAESRLIDEVPSDTKGWTDYADFSPDGRVFLSATFDRTTWGALSKTSSVPPHGATRLWDTATRLPLGPTLDEGVAWSATFNRDGTTVLTGCLDGQVRFNRVPTPIRGEVPAVSIWVRVVTGLELDPDGKVRTLDAERWRGLRDRLDESGGVAE